MPLPDEALIRRYYALFNERALAEAATLVAPDCEFEHRPTRSHTRGPGGYLALAEEWLQAFPDAQIEVERIETMSEWQYRATLTLRGHRDGVLEIGPGALVGGDRRPFSLRVVQEIRIRDGLLAAASMTFDRSELARGPTDDE